MTIVFAIRLVLMILDLNEVTINGIRIQGQRDQSVDYRSFVNSSKGPGLFILELNEIPVIFDDFIFDIMTVLEELRQCEPLTCHLVTVVCVNELIVVDTVRRVALDSFDSGLTGIQRNDIVNEGLSIGRKFD